MQDVDIFGAYFSYRQFQSNGSPTENWFGFENSSTVQLFSYDYITFLET